MNYVIGENIDEIQVKIIKKILQEGKEVKPRGMLNRELTGFSFRLNNPRARITYNLKRKFNLMFAVGELFWYLSGSNLCETITYYNKRYPNFSDDGEVLNGAYGYRIFTSSINGINQWKEVKDLLKRDPDTRQAIINIHMPRDLVVSSKDIPCTCYLQFLIRDNKLDLIANMRSNDIIWGTPYDVFSFTMMQELMATELGLDVGVYTHFAGSIHLYEQHNQLAIDMLKEEKTKVHLMPKMPYKFTKDLKEVLRYEELIRVNKQYEIKSESIYWNDLLNIIKINSANRSDNSDEFIRFYDELPEYYKQVIPTPKIMMSKQG
ncbi:thymidylate synthase [Bacillus cereus]|uniref:thymidylate synthase n=1 Tax=Bacillus cereus TaxID=1396 RepID=UPI00123B0758|nr:thymidylate synthase [Bacillus cereus]KAA6470288.1 thymidylate synthase [Bacillus cereus]